jgi:GGDEF domain-containing protein
MTKNSEPNASFLSLERSNYDSIGPAYLPSKLPFLATAFCAVFLFFWSCFELDKVSVGLIYLSLFALIFVVLYRSQNDLISTQFCFLIVAGLWVSSLLSSYLIVFPDVWFSAFICSTYSMLRAKWASLCLLMVAPFLLLVSHSGLGVETCAALIATAFFAHHARQLFDRYRDQLSCLSLQDPMSGCGNQQALSYDMDRNLQLFDRYHIPCTAMAIELRLEQLASKGSVLDNDHPLYAFLNIWKSRIRQTDRLYRSGEFSFVCLLANTRESDALGLQKDILNACMHYEIESTEQFSLSVKVHECREQDDPNKWLERLHQVAEISAVCGGDKTE